MLKAGIPLNRAMETVVPGMKSKKMREVISDIAFRIKSGVSFSEAISFYPRIFPEVIVNLIRAGENGGILAETLTGAADYIEEGLGFKNKLRSALAYPLIVIIVGLLMLIFLSAFLIPTFNSMFSDLGVSLPGVTRLVIFMGELVRKFWHVIIISGVLGWGLMRGRTGERLRTVFPLWRELTQKAVLSRTLGTLGKLLGSSVPIVTALKVTASTSGNSIYKDIFWKIIKEVEAGEKLASSMREYKVFPEMTLQMVAAGEASGTLAERLCEVAKYYEKESERQIKLLSSLVEPVATLGVGLMVGLIVVAMFLPLLKISASLTF